ncbi:hypothetical protein Tco_0393638 [Tanacetum coccineum]
MTQYCFVCSCLLLLEQLKDGWIESLQELSTLGTSLKRPLSKGIVHHPRLLNDLNTSTTSSRKAMNHYTKLGNVARGGIEQNISSSSDTDGLAAVISKLDNLGRDMNKLKENVYAIQVGCQICEGPHLDKECPLNEEVKQMDEVSSMVNLGAPLLSTQVVEPSSV